MVSAFVVFIFFFSFKVSVMGLSVYVVVCHWGGQLDRESWYTIKYSLTCQSWLSRPGSCLPCVFDWPF